MKRLFKENLLVVGMAMLLVVMVSLVAATSPMWGEGQGMSVVMAENSIPLLDEDGNKITELQIEQLEDSTALDAEFAALEEESIFVVEEVERQREEAKRSKIWGAVIIVLVVAIFAVGIVSVLRERKTGNEIEIEDLN